MDEGGFHELYAAIRGKRVVPAPEHRLASPDDWMHYLWDGDRRACVEAKRELESVLGLIEIWSLQDGGGSTLYVENGARYVDNLGWFLVRQNRKE